MKASEFLQHTKDRYLWDGVGQEERCSSFTCIALYEAANDKCSTTEDLTVRMEVLRAYPACLKAVAEALLELDAEAHKMNNFAYSIPLAHRNDIRYVQLARHEWVQSIINKLKAEGS